MTTNRCRFIPSRAAFSLIELLVVVGIIGILAALILAAVNRAKESGLKTECLSNQDQLNTTWALFATDNNDDLVANYRWRKFGRPGFTGPVNERFHIPWVTGTGHPNIGGMTDEAFILDPQFAAFAPYLRRKEIYRCPSTREVITGKEAIRSYGMNPFMGNYHDSVFGTNWFRFRHMEDITRPEFYFTFMDLNQKFICFPMMIVHMDRNAWHHPPSTEHNYGATIAFADGHVEYKRWREDPTQGSAAHPRWNVGPHSTLTQPGDQDVAWVREHATFEILRNSGPGGEPQ